VSQPRYLADEDFRRDIVEAVRRIDSSIDVGVVQELGMSGTPDVDLLEWAAREGRIVVTHDVKTMTAEAIRRIERGLAMPGKLIVPQRVQGGLIAETMAEIALGSEDYEWFDVIEYLPW
jgi:hypothetical protein